MVSRPTLPWEHLSCTGGEPLQHASRSSLSEVLPTTFLLPSAFQPSAHLSPSLAYLRAWRQEAADCFRSAGGSGLAGPGPKSLRAAHSARSRLVGLMPFRGCESLRLYVRHRRRTEYDIAGSEDQRHGVYSLA